MLYDLFGAVVFVVVKFVMEDDEVLRFVVVNVMCVFVKVNGDEVWLYLMVIVVCGCFLVDIFILVWSVAFEVGS